MNKMEDQDIGSIVVLNHAGNKMWNLKQPVLGKVKVPENYEPVQHVAPI